MEGGCVAPLVKTGPGELMGKGIQGAHGRGPGQGLLALAVKALSHRLLVKSQF